MNFAGGQKIVVPRLFTIASGWEQKQQRPTNVQLRTRISCCERIANSSRYQSRRFINKKLLPELKEYFREEISLPCIDHCIGKLADLTVKSARNELVTNIIPKYCSREDDNEKGKTNDNGEEGDNNEQTDVEAEEDDKNTRRKHQTNKDCLLWAYLASSISVTTTWQWLRRLGFHFDIQKKSFFFDGHERPPTWFSINASSAQTI